MENATEVTGAPIEVSPEISRQSGYQSSPLAAAEPSTVTVAHPKPGMRFEGRAIGQAHRVFTLKSLDADEYIYLEVEQRGIDLIVTISDPEGQTLVRVDDTSDIEKVAIVTTIPGDHHISLQSWPGAQPDSGFELQILERHPPSPEDRIRALETLTLYEANNNYSSGKKIIHKNPKKSIEHLLQSLHLFRQLKRVSKEAFALYHLSRAEKNTGNRDQAANYLEESIPLMDAHGSFNDRATLRNDLAVVYTKQGRIASAANLYREAIELWQTQGDSRRQATTRTNLGVLYISRGAIKQAIDEYRIALALLGQENHSAQFAITLTRLGDALLQSEGPEAALRHYEQALHLRREMADSRGEAITRNSIGLAYVEKDEPQLALDSFRQSLETFLKNSDKAGAAVVRNNLGRALERLGQLNQAQEHFESALKLAQAVSQKHTEAESLFGLARLESKAMRLQAARRLIEQSLQLIESIRSQTEDPDLRSSFLAVKQDYYDFLIDLLVKLALQEPGSGHEASAYEAFERARARSLLETLAETRARLAQGDYSPHSLESLIHPKIPTLKQIQTNILDKETILLAYHLGEDRSYLWAIDADQILLFNDLPNREVLERMALDFFKKVQRSHYETGRIPARRSAARISDTLLGPVAHLLGKQRLVIIASGALEYVPFSALLELPRTESNSTATQNLPVALRHEIIRLPSIAVLEVLRHRPTKRQISNSQIAILADPVFAPEQSLQPLPYTRHEAKAILAAASGDAFAAFGHEATRELVLSGRLSEYRILHFATHASLDTENPEHSAILLSGLNPAGQMIEGRLHGYEIFGLDLSADLVVLSACRTALGSKIRGEGLVGLARGFMHTGTRQVVVSLWDVNDSATAELMKHFYHGLFLDELSPPHALKQAQIALQNHPRWRSPYYWAGFVLIGDWR